MAGRADPSRDRNALGTGPEIGHTHENRSPRLPDSPVVVDSAATVAYVGRIGEADSDQSSHPDSDSTRAEIAGGRFQVIRPHARGGLGEVFVAFDRELKRSVALKELQASLAHDPAAQARFLLEAEVTGSLEHPGIVPVYSLGRYADGRPYYAMHLVQGETLRAAIDRFHHQDDVERLARAPKTWRSGGSCVLSSTPVMQSPTLTAAGSFTATSSPRTSCSAGSAKPSSSIGASPSGSSTSR